MDKRLDIDIGSPNGLGTTTRYHPSEEPKSPQEPDQKGENCG